MMKLSSLGDPIVPLKHQTREQGAQGIRLQKHAVDKAFNRCEPCHAHSPAFVLGNCCPQRLMVDWAQIKSFILG